MSSIVKFLLLGCCCLLAAPSLVASSPYKSYFSHRYPFLETNEIELQQLRDTLREVVLVDVRSPYEYEALHINKAVNYPVDAEGFVDQIRALRSNTSKVIVFYCNDPGCKRSRRAITLAKKNNIYGVVNFDPGIFYWAAIFPELTVSFGKLSLDLDNLMATTAYTGHIIPRSEFTEMARKQGGVVLDIRGNTERRGKGLYSTGNEKRVDPNDNGALNRAIDQAVSENKTLLIYDNIGDRTRLLPYRLKERGVSSYYFLAKGAAGDS